MEFRSSDHTSQSKLGFELVEDGDEALAPGAALGHPDLEPPEGLLLQRLQVLGQRRGGGREVLPLRGGGRAVGHDPGEARPQPG
eukprot:1191813-Prorocentrum_minimum.AAC.5